MNENFHGNDEPRWHASIAVALALGLYVTLPPKVTFGPLWLFPLLVLLILVPLSVISPMRRHESRGQRIASLACIAILTFLNIVSLILLVIAILNPHHSVKLANGEKLLLAGIQIWFTNILVFALWYWELDAGGPEARAHTDTVYSFEKSDFFFPQMSMPGEVPKFLDRDWKPLFVDYLYVAFTNSSAFSPADTFPLTRMAKMLMMAEALTSFITIGIIVSRAVGILG